MEVRIYWALDEHDEDTENVRNLMKKSLVKRPQRRARKMSESNIKTEL
jgi:hypothetical protein